VYLIRDDVVCLAMKKRGFGEGNWNGYGGKLEEGESIKDAAVRELNEESGVSVLVEHLDQVAVAEFLFEDGRYYLQFGYGSSTDLEETSPLEPSNIVLQRQGKNYISDINFDPTKLISGDKLGIAPANTTLFVTYRKNTTRNSSAANGTITSVSNALFEFGSSATNNSTKNTVITSLEVDNEEPIIGEVYSPTVEEMKIKIYGSFGAQNRAVTKADYENVAYNMPSMFGSIKRCAAIPSADKGQRIINFYTVSEDSNGHLVSCNDALKENLKIWIAKHKMLNDSIQILDAKIVNFAIDYVVLTSGNVNSVTLIKNIADKISELFENPHFIGESLNIVNIYSAINSVDGVADTTKIIIHEKSGGLYSGTKIGLNNLKTSDGRLIVVPNDTILELKYPNLDIRGMIK
jgi:ADP-ribose pyrophosphatase YjhB (NUDIX family)